MQILGFQKLTLLDYPGHVAATIFTGGCNFKCPFCQNARLVNYEDDELDNEKIIDYLNNRKKYLDAVCITGGEPTIQKDLKGYIKKIKELGYLVKLDTNGTNPNLLKELIDEKLIDYVAMDIKNSKKKYSETSGTKVNIDNIEESIKLLMNGNIDYEFRTTIVKDYHENEDIIEISKWLKDSKKYVLQQFEDSGHLIKDGLKAHPKEKLCDFKQILEKEIKNVEIRGI